MTPDHETTRSVILQAGRFARIAPKAIFGPLRRLAALRNAVTLGVRVALRDTDGRILLVRHTYVPGWYLPGGAVDPGESATVAARRELREETGIDLVGEPRLFGLYHDGRRDHVALYAAQSTGDVITRPPDAEIAEVAFFDADRLPGDVTPATCRRLAEIAGERIPSERW